MPVTIVRSALSSTSVTRRQVMPVGPNPGMPPRCATLSVSAASRLCAEPTACASPVKCMFTSSCGSTSDSPPPVPPPLMPNIGPSDGSRSVATTFLPSRPKPCAIPTVVVVLPSPAGVGVIPVTTMSLPRLPPARMASSGIFALYLPCGIIAFVSSPSSAATSVIGRIVKDLIYLLVVRWCLQTRRSRSKLRARKHTDFSTRRRSLPLTALAESGNTLRLPQI